MSPAAELCPSVFKAASRREPWLPYQCQKTLGAERGPLISRYLPINHRHNFPSNGCWKLHQVHPDGFRIQGIFPEVVFFFLCFFFFSAGEAGGMRCWRIHLLSRPFSALMNKSIYSGQVHFLWVIFFFCLGPDNNSILHVSIVASLGTHLYIPEVMRCNIAGIRGRFFFAVWFLSCLCNLSVLLSSEACQLRLGNVSEVNGHKPISSVLPSSPLLRAVILLLSHLQWQTDRLQAFLVP